MFGSHLIHYLKFILSLDQPKTQTSLDEQKILIKYASGKNKALEIGVFESVNTVLIARNLSHNGLLFGIDPFFKGKLGVCWHKQIAKLNIKRSGLKSRITLIEKLSVDAASEIPNDLDFIFIDGDHSLKGITNDWAIYSSKLKPGGIIALHDTAATTHQKWKEEMDSVKYFESYIRHQKGFKILETVDSLNVLQKL